MKRISGKIVNHDKILNGTIEFSQSIQNVVQSDKIESKNIIIPGFIDLHCHGGNGFDTMEGLESIIQMSNYHLSYGTTTLLPTTLTASLDSTSKALAGLKNFIAENKYTSNIIGVHLEGPFINPNKLGAQPPFTQKPNIDFIKKIQELAIIKIITLAPEIEKIDNLIQYLIDNSISIQIGHSLADYNICIKLMNRHQVGFTHLFNAMSGCDHHNPGVVTAALNQAKYAEIICDLIHVDSANILLAHKSIKKLYAITDSISATGMPDGNYSFSNLKIEKKENKALVYGNTLAGSIINMHDTFKNLIKINFSLEQAVAMTSYNAAQYIKEYDKGVIAKDFCANLLVLDQQFEIKEIYLYGNLITK